MRQCHDHCLYEVFVRVKVTKIVATAQCGGHYRCQCASVPGSRMSVRLNAGITMDVGTPQNLGHSFDTESTQIPSTQHDSLQTETYVTQQRASGTGLFSLPRVTRTNLPTWG